MQKIGTFREWLREAEIKELNEFRKSDEYGLDVSGHLIDLSIRMGKNKLVEIVASGKKTLPKLKSIEILKKEYSEENFKELEKSWKDLAEKESVKIENLVQKFEDDLNKIIIDMEKEIAKLD